MFKKREEMTQADKLWNKKHNSDVHLQWIHVIEDHEDELNDWERGFILSIKSKVIVFQELSEAQIEKLEQIYNKF